MSKDIVLTRDIVLDIQKVVIEIMKEHLSSPDYIIKEGIFDILEKKCTVIYYPLSNEINRGFHIRRLVKDKIEDFVYINTEKTVEQQVFTAAHELGHIYDVYSKVCDLTRKRGENLDKFDQDFEEKVTDRFAAELIMPEVIFTEITKEYIKSNKLSNHTSLFGLLVMMAKLMDYFTSPFDAIRKRLFETDFIDDKTNRLFSDNKDELIKIIELLKKEDNSVINSKTEVKTISGLRSVINEAIKCEKTDKNLIKKLKNDFELEDVDKIDQQTSAFKLTDIVNINN